MNYTFIYFFTLRLLKAKYRSSIFGIILSNIFPLFSAIILVILGPMVWVETLGFEKPIFPYKYPGLFSMVISFISIITISLIDKKNKNEEMFHKLVKKSHLGRT